MNVRTACVAIAFAIMSASAAAAEPSSGLGPDLSVTGGGRVAVTTGYLTWSVPSSTGSPNVLSELRWRGIDAVVPEINADVVWKRLVARAAIGGGMINQGVLIDDDFRLDDRQGRFSHTRSDVEDEGLVYANLDVGVRLLTWGERPTPSLGYVDVLVGYQYWYERYVAFGATGTVSIPPSVKAITEDFTWHSLRVGARAQVPLYRGLGLKLSTAFLPWTRTELEDTHHLRSDLKKNPSISAEAEGGFGVQLDGTLTYHVWKGLSVDVGYQYWRIDSGEGERTQHTVSGNIKTRLNEIVIERYGPHLGITYRF